MENVNLDLLHKRPVKPTKIRYCEKCSCKMSCIWSLAKNCINGGYWRYRCYKCLYKQSSTSLKHPDYNAKKTIDARNRLYGITTEQYNAMLLLQKGVCAICGNTETRKNNDKIAPLSVDHNHNTGKVRSLICHTCNVAIGYAKDSPHLLRKMADYLESWL